MFEERQPEKGGFETRRFRKRKTRGGKDGHGGTVPPEATLQSSNAKETGPGGLKESFFQEEGRGGKCRGARRRNSPHKLNGRHQQSI